MTILELPVQSSPRNWARGERLRILYIDLLVLLRRIARHSERRKQRERGKGGREPRDIYGGWQEGGFMGQAWNVAVWGAQRGGNQMRHVKIEMVSFTRHGKRLRRLSSGPEYDDFEAEILLAKGKTVIVVWQTGAPHPEIALPIPWPVSNAVRAWQLTRTPVLGGRTNGATYAW